MPKTTEAKIYLAAFLAVIQIFIILVFAGLMRLPVGVTSFLLLAWALAWVALLAVVFIQRMKGKQAPSQPERQPHAAHAASIADKGRESLLDIGFIATFGKNTVVPYRTKPLPTSVEAIQPFIQIHNRRMRPCRIVFEILDDRSKLIFSRAIEKIYPQGVHIITPAARLRIGSQTPSGMWALRIRFNNQVLALHHFGWHVDEVVSLDGRINADGEIDEHIAAMLVDDYSAPLSLDDLLAQQEPSSFDQNQR
jgi:hypothetical protein